MADPGPKKAHLCAPAPVGLEHDASPRGATPVAAAQSASAAKAQDHAPARAPAATNACERPGSPHARLVNLPSLSSWYSGHTHPPGAPAYDLPASADPVQASSLRVAPGVDGFKVMSPDYALHQAGQRSQAYVPRHARHVVPRIHPLPPPMTPSIPPTRGALAPLRLPPVDFQPIYLRHQLSQHAYVYTHANAHGALPDAYDPEAPHLPNLADVSEGGGVAQLLPTSSNTEGRSDAAHVHTAGLTEAAVQAALDHHLMSGGPAAKSPAQVASQGHVRSGRPAAKSLAKAAERWVEQSRKSSQRFRMKQRTEWLRMQNALSSGRDTIRALISEIERLEATGRELRATVAAASASRVAAPVAEDEGTWAAVRDAKLRLLRGVLANEDSLPPDLFLECVRKLGRLFVVYAVRVDLSVACVLDGGAPGLHTGTCAIHGLGDVDAARLRVAVRTRETASVSVQRNGESVTVFVVPVATTHLCVVAEFVGPASEDAPAEE